MNTLNDRQQATLARGLDALELATRRRRNRRRAVRGGAALSLVLLVGTVLYRASIPAPAALPGYVEIVRDDRQLVAELELANACERISRSGGELVVVECMLPEGDDAATPAVRPVG